MNIILVAGIICFVLQHLIDMDQKTVHVFQPEGSYLTPLGSQGRGPGEDEIYEWWVIET